MDSKKTNQWLNSARLKAETEGLIIVAQDQSLATRKNHRHHIIKEGTDPHCRLCHSYEETVEHLVSGCPEFAKTEYIQRHNKVAAYLNWKICREHEMDTVDKWYEHTPTTVDITILWDMPIHTDRTISNNRPDIIVKNKRDI